MNSPTSLASDTARRTLPWVRLHAALMPDYNRRATLYWWTLVLLGAGVLAHSAAVVAALSASGVLQAVSGMVIAMLAGCFPVRIPRSKSSFAAGEVFIFLLLLLQGPAAATLAAGAETMVGALRSSKRWTSRIASPAFSAVAMISSGSLLQAGLGELHRRGFDNGGLIVIATVLCSLLFFTGNTLLVSAVPRLKRNELLKMSDWLSVFGWVGIIFGGSGAVSALLYLTFRQSGLGVLAAMLPILAMLLATLHWYNRHQEALEEADRSAIEAAAHAAEAAAAAAEREAETAERHLQLLEESERRFHGAFTHASIGMALLSFDGCILQANAALRTLLGEAGIELRQHRFDEFVAEADRKALDAQMALVDADDFDGFALELRCLRRDGDEVWVAVHCGFFSEPGATTPCLILQTQNIDSRRKAEAGLQYIAFHDTLTGLPNRRCFGQHLAQAVEAAQLDPRQGFAVMFIDFDRFKLVNDSLGHAAGDEFLVQIAKRIQLKLRPQDIVARLGGDEFAILSLQIAREGDIVLLADRLLAALAEPFRVGDTELKSSASIGITTSVIGYSDAADVLRDADIAMYKAKAAGKARYALFDVALHAEVARQLMLEGELRRALAQSQLSVVYQPLYDMASGCLTGFEALARWTHAEHGIIGPNQFIPIAEESGLIVPLTDFVLERACEQLAQWHQLDAGLDTLTMHVNISGKDLAYPGLVGRVTRALVRSRLQAQHLKLELTENILMERLELAVPLLQELRSLGVAISVDDFGTGFSSLAHLSRLPIDSLKVDRSFISELIADSKDAAVVRAIVQLGNTLGKEVIAEGIETPLQYDLLREMGCQTGQGHHMSRPLTAPAVELLLAARMAEATLGQSVTSFGRQVVLH